MSHVALTSTAFRGDEDASELRSFFLPERQFAGDTRWRFGTSLRSAYVNSYEFLNHAPVVQLWRDADRDLQAVSRLSLGTGEWFFQAAPDFRDDATATDIIEQADSAFELLSDFQRWRTVMYEGDHAGIELLERHGYEVGDRDEVFMTMSLDSALEPDSATELVEIRFLDRTNLSELRERALAQVDAFSGGTPSESELSWIHRTLPHQLSHAADQSVNLVAMDSAETCLAFADIYLDPINGFGEYEPVGTRTRAQRRGLSAAVLQRGLIEMKSAGMTTAIVRTGVDNTAAIAAYESVGFEIVDHRISLHRQR